MPLGGDYVTFMIVIHSVPKKKDTIYVVCKRKIEDCIREDKIRCFFFLSRYAFSNCLSDSGNLFSRKTYKSKDYTIYDLRTKNHLRMFAIMTKLFDTNDSTNVTKYLWIFHQKIMSVFEQHI